MSLPIDRKTQTTKDLTKPWTQLPLVPASLSDSKNNSPDTAQTQAHSALTTILLDDSPLKAHLQPYNHVCIREYVASLRGKDLEVFAKERVMSNGVGEKRKRKQKKKAEKAQKKARARGKNVMTDPGVVDRLDNESETSVSSEPQSPPSAQPSQPVIQEQETEAIEDGPVDGGRYDETLLAVIGILDEVKEQSNVAAWIRAGGLWGPVNLRPPPPAQPSPSAPNTEVGGAGNDTTLSQDQNQGISPSEIIPSADKVVWFDHEPTFVYWARRGRKAVHELGIEVVHGVTG